MNGLDFIIQHPLTHMDKCVMMRTTMSRLRRKEFSVCYDTFHRRSTQAFNRHLLRVGKLDQLVTILYKKPDGKIVHTASKVTRKRQGEGGHGG